jgi:hypothetical protein
MEMVNRGGQLTKTMKETKEMVNRRVSLTNYEKRYRENGQ